MRPSCSMIDSRFVLRRPPHLCTWQTRYEMTTQKDWRGQPWSEDAEGPTILLVNIWSPSSRQLWAFTLTRLAHSGAPARALWRRIYVPSRLVDIRGNKKGVGHDDMGTTERTRKFGGGRCSPF
ncbi:hypothetical protein MAPG_04177 [Magnaporthiopsis poae ATCC 64411]|uniref:Uncharacterized protein n=1 Tax=Magnaporthiopsis poae (strain ATCC 64411 / 73-15) TaxID=644358 RepID=A0A0C4DW10_MAGP6|nr:hypothetical protein MAPG_04177 [Magnaporthiopsis poae ATCC 64411]